MTMGVFDASVPAEVRMSGLAPSAPSWDGGVLEPAVAEHLQDLVLDSADVADFLLELSKYSAALAAKYCGGEVDCAITLSRQRRALTSAGNTDRARSLNDHQLHRGQGPALTALRHGQTMVVRGAAADGRWPEHAQALIGAKIHSVLAVPLILEQGAAASLSFFSPNPSIFSEGVVRAAEHYATKAQRTLRLAVRINSKQQLAEDLQAAMRSRTAIDLAVGVIIGQQRCSQSAAFEILTRAASTRNRKLRDIAMEMLANLTVENVKTRFDA
ncbi:GAF and ANTAR domain-containing protein [Arthrobacter sp. TMN-49]